MPVRVAIVGTGFGARVHVPAFRWIPGVEVVAICSARLDRALAAAEELNVPCWFDDYSRMLVEVRPDAVSIATPPEQHAPMALAALEAGAHVLCEKPLAENAAAARKMLDRARSSGLVHAVGHERRYFPAYFAIKRILDDGGIGRVTGAAVQLFSWPRASFHDPAWGWLVQEGGGGGVLGLYGTHYFDLLRWWFGEPERLYCRTSTAIESRVLPHDGKRHRVRSEDTATAVLEFHDRVIATLHLSLAARQGTGPRVEIYGTKGSLLADEAGGLSISKGRHPAPFRPVSLDPGLAEIPEKPRELRPYVRLVERFVGAIRGGSRPEPDFEDGYRSVAMMEACRRSSALGRALERDEIWAGE